jgi:hypothetical protein
MLRVSAAGMPIDPVPVTLILGTKQPADDGMPTIAWGGGETGLLVWDNGVLSAVAIDRDFHLTSAVHTIGPASTSDVHVAFDGAAYLVASLGKTYGPDSNNLRLTIVSPDAMPGESIVVQSTGTPGSVTGAGAGRALITYVRPANGPPALDGVSRAFSRMVNDLGELPLRQRTVKH